MKTLIVLISIIAAGKSAVVKVEKKCTKERVAIRQECTEEKHAGLGAAAGWLVLGPVGAVAGAIVGSNPDKTCREVEERTCVEWEEK